MKRTLRWIVIGALALAGGAGMVILSLRLERDRPRIETELQNLRPTEVPTSDGYRNP